jgi:hypothetical protein
LTYEFGKFGYGYCNYAMQIWKDYGGIVVN